MNKSVLYRLIPAISLPAYIRNKYSFFLGKSFLLVASIAPVLVLGPAAYAQVTSLGTVNVGTSGATNPVSVTFNQAATLAGVSVLTQGVSGLEFANAGGSTCAIGTAYNQGDICTVNVSFTPQFAGTANGAIVLSGGSGNVIANAYISATGAGPQIKFMPGTETQISSGLSSPETVVADGNGNLYIADSGNNRVLKETLAGGSYTESVIPTSALNWPAAAAVDGSGNVYIADTFNSRILKETLNAGTYTETTISTSQLQYPFGITLDTDGDIYIPDTLNNRVLKETLSGGTYTESTIPTSALNLPVAVALDSSENVYIVDNGSSRVLKETFSAGNYTESVVPGSPLIYPAGVAVDAVGSIYIADTNNSRVVVETPAGASYTETILPTGSLLSYPTNITLDGAGNVYISDQGNNRVVKEDYAAAPTLTFASTTANTVNPTPQIVQVENAGTSALNFSAVSFPSDFPELSPAPTDCNATTSLTSAATCSLSITFAPNAPLDGNASVQLTEGVAVTTNTLNVPATQQIVTVTGTELQP